MKNVSWADFYDQFRKVIIRYIRTGYNINVMRQSAYLVVNQIMVNIFASLFNSITAGLASDSIMGFVFQLIRTGVSLVCYLVIRCSTGGFLFLRFFFSVVVSHPMDLQVSRYVVSYESSYLTHHRPYS